MIAHVFVDAENIPPSVTFKVVEHFGKEHTITKVDIIAKEDTLPYKYRGLDEKIYHVQNCFYGKNSADTWLCFEMVRAIIDEPDLELIIIISSDKDFLPAIKFAVDFDKKVFIVSNGAGHKSLVGQMKTLGINPDAVELKDFRLKFGDLPLKLERFLPQFSFAVKKFFFDREDRIKFILVRRGEKILEVPFVEGMTIYMFRRVLSDLNILGNSGSIKNFIAENYLKLTRNRIYFRSEKEISVPTAAEIVDDYLNLHAAELKKIFIKHNQKMFEVPFVDGISVEFFGKLLREKNIIGKSTSATSIARKNFLDVRDGKIFLCDEERLSELYAESTGNLDAYFYENDDKTIKIFVKHDGNISEIPFINGMPLTLFEKVLRERKIIDKNFSAVEIAIQSLLDVRDERVFLYSEDAY